MEQELTKERALELMKLKGQVRGAVFKTDREFVLKEEGENGLKLLEEEMKRLGYPIKYKEIESTSFHPIGLRAISLLTIKKVFGFDNDKIQEMGLFATKVSLIVRLFVRYFSSTEKFLLEKAPALWKRHWTEGSLVVSEVNMKEKYSIAQIKDFNLCPAFCYYLRGYFEGILHLTTGSSRVDAQEVKCFFQGDKHHEYLIRWE
jgi:predicted hydrocarbon binding protein